ncbi:hypothetical protein GGI17_005855 [Coemansia sp. S146]|nr:hypothetical protein GGI17_005855 [Coemansia sp. S146]
MDNDSFESFINQSLVDSSAINTGDGGDVGVENALLLQLLMSGVAPTATGTIDPSELSVGVAGGEGAFLAADDAGQNALLATALFSVLDAMPPIAVGNAMLVDSPPPTAAVTPTATVAPTATVTPTATVAQPKEAPAAKRKQTAPAQAPGTAAARKRASGVSGGPAAKKPATGAPPTVAAADRASPAATAEASGLASPGEENENDDDSVDPKSLPPMKRRQLRNKISARNFRVRRKEQLTTLLSDSIAHKEEVDGLRAELAAARKDNAVMREEIRKLRLRLGTAAVPPAPATATAVTAASGKVGQATPVPTRPVPQQKQQQQQPSAVQPQTPSRPQPPTLTRPAPQQQQQPPSVQAQVQPPNQPPQLPAAGAKVAPTMVPAASVARFNPHKDVGQAGPKKDGNWAAKNDRSGFIAVNTTTVPASHAERLESLAAETQNRRAVEALLNVGDGTHHPSPVAHDVLATFEKVAEYILSQIVLESSFALAHAGSHSAKVSC